MDAQTFGTAVGGILLGAWNLWLHSKHGENKQNIAKLQADLGAATAAVSEAKGFIQAVAPAVQQILGMLKAEPAGLPAAPAAATTPRKPLPASE